MTVKLKPPAAEDAVLIVDGAAAQVDPDVVVITDGKADDGELPRGAKRNDDGSLTLTLRYAVELKWKISGSEEVRVDRYESLVFNRLTGADMRAIGATSRESTITVGLAKSARMNEVKMAAIFDRMDGVDAQAAALVLTYFLGNGQTTGR